MKIYTLEKNNGPDYGYHMTIAVKSLEISFRDALATFKNLWPDVIKYQRLEPRMEGAIPGGKCVFWCEADGWWWGIFEHETRKVDNEQRSSSSE